MHLPNVPSAMKEEEEDGKCEQGSGSNSVSDEDKRVLVPTLLTPIGGDTKMIRAPFPRTFRHAAAGVNVAFLSLSSHIHFYWGTALSPRPGLDVDSADAHLVPNEVRRFIADLYNESSSKLRLWLLKGNVLPQNARGLERVPYDTRARLSVGFMDWRPTMRPMGHNNKLRSRIVRLHSVLSNRGGLQLGVRPTKDGNGRGFRFSVRRITGMLMCTAQELAGLLADHGIVCNYFSGKVSYGVRDEQKGLICMAGGMPNGDWFARRFRDTGFGLLCRNQDVYYRVVYRGPNACRLVRVRGGDIDWEKWSPRSIKVANVIE